MFLGIGYTIIQRGDRNLNPTPPPPETGLFQLESGSGHFELEDSNNKLALE